MSGKFLINLQEDIHVFLDRAQQTIKDTMKFWDNRNLVGRVYFMTGDLTEELLSLRASHDSRIIPTVYIKDESTIVIEFYDPIGEPKLVKRATISIENTQPQTTISDTVPFMDQKSLPVLEEVKTKPSKDKDNKPEKKKRGPDKAERKQGIVIGREPFIRLITTLLHYHSTMPVCVFRHIYTLYFGYTANHLVSASLNYWLQDTEVRRYVNITYKSNRPVELSLTTEGELFYKGNILHKNENFVKALSVKKLISESICINDADRDLMVRIICGGEAPHVQDKVVLMRMMKYKFFTTQRDVDGGKSHIILNQYGQWLQDWYLKN